MQEFKLRREYRVPLEAEVRSTDLPGLRAQALDLSSSGMQLEFKARYGQEPPAGTSVAFHLELGMGRVADGLARIAWVRRQGLKVRVGLIFEMFDPPSRRYLESFLSA